MSLRIDISISSTILIKYIFVFFVIYQTNIFNVNIYISLYSASNDGQSLDEYLVETVSADFVLQQVRDHMERGGPSSKSPYVKVKVSRHLMLESIFLNWFSLKSHFQKGIENTYTR